MRGVQEDLLECSGGERREATFLEGLLLAFYSPLPALVTGFLLPWRKFPTPSAAKQKKNKFPVLCTLKQQQLTALGGLEIFILVFL